MVFKLLHVFAVIVAKQCIAAEYFLTELQLLSQYAMCGIPVSFNHFDSKLVIKKRLQVFINLYTAFLQCCCFSKENMLDRFTEQDPVL